MADIRVFPNRYDEGADEIVTRITGLGVTSSFGIITRENTFRVIDASALTSEEWGLIENEFLNNPRKIFGGSEAATDSTTDETWAGAQNPAYRYSPTLEVGKYLVLISAEISNDDASGGVEARLEGDDTLTMCENTFHPNVADDWITMARIAIFNCPSAGVHNFDFDFRRLDSNGNAKIRRKGITFIKVVE